MKLGAISFALASFLVVSSVRGATTRTSLPQRRIVILKVDGLNADLLFQTMGQLNRETGRSQLPWIAHIFSENGTIFQNFYTRGISLSAPSWSELDTGHHTIIRGNVEYDRYTGQIYDYLNFFPFYIGYARQREVDMPGVEVLDRAGVPLLLDNFPYENEYQSFQLYQRGVRWSTLASVLKQRFSSKSLLSLIEGSGPSLDELWSKQTEVEVGRALQNPSIRYVDLFTGDVDHQGHASSDPAGMLEVLVRLDALCGRLWTAIQNSPGAHETLFVMISDHGMNNQPGVISQSFSLPDLLNSPEGGAHHVITNRHEFSDFKLRGLDPLVQRVVNPSRASFYLKDQADQYPTAWVDLDGNERASLHLRNSDFNKLHIMLLELAKPSETDQMRSALVQSIAQTIDGHRAAWERTATQLDEELEALQAAIRSSKEQLKLHPIKKPRSEQKESGEDKAYRRIGQRVSAWEHETDEYKGYVRHLRSLLELHLDPGKAYTGKISDLIPEMSLGDNNSLHDLQNYIAGPAEHGLVLDGNGCLDEEHSFVRVNYLALFVAQIVRNNPQRALSSHPVDFVALRIPVDIAKEVYLLHGANDDELLILRNSEGQISLRPVRDLSENAEGHFQWHEQGWKFGLPLKLFEDEALRVPVGVDRASWLSSWHTEREWFDAIARCRYSNGVIGVIEELSPVGENVPGTPGMIAVQLRYERRRRELVQPDLQLFAADHWNFNVRNPNAGGNHGSFLRMSTHSVWMMAGGGIPTKTVEEPHDSLDFTPCLLGLAGLSHSTPFVNADVSEPGVCNTAISAVQNARQ